MSVLMNNKRLGTAFEREFVGLLADRGYWVHFISPSPTGGQPFDVVAAKDGKAYAFDCKTSVAKRFPLTRLEDNQRYAFERWIACGNPDPCLAVKYLGKIYIVPYTVLKGKGVVFLNEDYLCSL